MRPKLPQSHLQVAAFGCVAVHVGCACTRNLGRRARYRVHNLLARSNVAAAHAVPASQCAAMHIHSDMISHHRQPLPVSPSCLRAQTLPRRAGMMPGITGMLQKVASTKGLDYEEWSGKLKEEHRFHVEVY